MRFPPPLVFLGFLLLGPVVDRFSGWPAIPSGALRWGVGGVLLIGAFAIIASAINLFRRAGENPEPWTGTAQLVDSGLYKYTRNPMYLAMAFAHFSLAVLIGSVGALATLPLAILAIHRFVIPQEEAYLARTLGATYADYCQRVRRWL